MSDGNQNVRGIRYARRIIDASAAQFSYTYGYPTAADQLSVRFRWDAAAKHIYQSTSTNGGSSWSAESVVPYHIPNSITIDGKDTLSVIFTYKKVADADYGVAEFVGNGGGKFANRAQFFGMEELFVGFFEL